jgi:hybrid cluster-associated redox disulfide protein
MLEASQGMLMFAPTLHITMAELLAECPAAGQVLARRGMACVGCVMAPFETLGEAARAYGTDPGELLRAVEAVRRRVPHGGKASRRQRRS